MTPADGPEAPETDRRARVAPAEAEERFRLSFEHAPTGVALVAPDGRWLRANRALCEILERSEEELLAGGFGGSTRPDDPNDLGAEAALVADVLAGRRRTYEVERCCRRPDGSVVPVLFSVALVRDASGRPLHFVSHVQDLTERRRDAEARRPRAPQERAAEQARRVHAVVVALAEALTVEQVTTAMSRHVRAALGADGLVLSLVDAAGRLRVAWMEGYREPVRAAVGDLAPDASLPLAEVVEARAPRFYESPQAYLAGHPERAWLARLSGKRAWAFLPLVASGRAVGSLGVGFGEERRFPDVERALMASVAGACAQALERARLYEAERATATALQRALLPGRLPEVAGTAVAVRYRPAAAGAWAGGDWYDALRLPQGTVGVVVGDVAGHDVGAAAVMGQLRTAVRAYAAEGHPPGAVVSRTNRLLAEAHPDVMATCCYVEFDPGSGTATAVRAGHPPPLVVGPGRARLAAEVDAGLPLGVDPDAAYAETTLFVAPGEAVVLYTDGLVEGPGLPLGAGLERLVAAAAAAGPAAGAEALADALVAAGGAGRGDDVALLVLGYEPAGGGPAGVCRRLPPDRASVGAARRFAADVLAEWGAGELADTAALLVSELVTNAVVCTATDVDVCLSLGPKRLRVEVADGSDHPPEPRAADAEATSGRGLFIVEALASAWGVEPRGAGKAVWFELGRPPALA